MKKVDKRFFNAKERGNLGENGFAQFVGFFAAHMIWMLDCIGPDEESVVPLIAMQNAGEYWYKRVSDDFSYERAVAMAREQLESMLSPPCGDYVLIAYDGFVTYADSRRDESLFIEAYDIRNPERITFLHAATPYRSPLSKEGLAIYRPIIIETANLPDINTFLNHCYEGAQIHTKGFEFWTAHMDTPLMKSAKQLFATVVKGDIETIQGLIEEGLYVNLADEDGRTFVHVAVLSGKKDIVEFLLKKGANIDCADKNGWTPLHYAVSQGHNEIVRFLLEKGANINAKDQHGWTVLRYVVHHGNKEMVEFLLQEGANIYTVDKEGFTLLHSAASEGHNEIVEFLLTKGVNINALDQSGSTPLHFAVDINDKVIVELLLKAGADIDIVDKEGLTPLDYAVNMDCEEVIEILSMEVS